jgi:hypothetical protein
MVTSTRLSPLSQCRFSKLMLYLFPELQIPVSDWSPVIHDDFCPFGSTSWNRRSSPHDGSSNLELAFDNFSNGRSGRVIIGGAKQANMATASN